MKWRQTARAFHGFLQHGNLSSPTTLQERCANIHWRSKRSDPSGLMGGHQTPVMKFHTPVQCFVIRHVHTCVHMYIYTCIPVKLYLIHIELPPRIALIHCDIRSAAWMWMQSVCHRRQSFWYSTLPSPFTFESAKLLATSTRAVEWYKSRAHISFLPEVIYVSTQRERGIVHQKVHVSRDTG